MRSRQRFAPPASGCGRAGAAGVTLVELLVVLVVLSTLAAVALPYAEVTLRRNNELELRQALRRIRTAIDAFHEDWERGRITDLGGTASADGYPKTLNVLVDGVDVGGAGGGRRYYLRRIPRDPLAPDQRVQPAEQWRLRSYRDGPGTRRWGGEDVYDVRSSSDGVALDGSRYADW